MMQAIARGMKLSKTLIYFFMLQCDNRWNFRAWFPETDMAIPDKEAHIIYAKIQGKKP